jgi:hypothetical protein
MEDSLADSDAITIVQGLPRYRLLVHKCSLLRPQVLDLVMVAHDMNCRMARLDRWVFEEVNLAFG